MANFEAKVVRVDSVEKHPNADRLDIVKIGGFNCVSGRFDDGTSQYREGDLCVYIPEGAVLTEQMLRYNGFWDEANGKGLLAGSEGNRVKAIKLRGVVSQGILHPVKKEDGFTNGIEGALYEPNEGKILWINVGDDVSEDLRITKYEPVIPASMSGEVMYLGSEHTLKYDIENIQKYPNVFMEGEPVVITEKLHGTFCAFGYNPSLNHPELLDGAFYAFSKSIGADGLVFKDNETNRTRNVYVKALHAHKDLLKTLHNAFLFDDESIIVCGELYGPGIQDLHYGETEAKFRLFDIYIRSKKLGEGFVDAQNIVDDPTIANGFEIVPVLFRGAFSMDRVIELRDGVTMLGGVNIREGVVVKPYLENVHDEIGRIVLKAVSPNYLLRKNPNATEFN